MGERNQGRPRARWTSLRMGEITLAMVVAMVTGLGVGLAALAVDRAWLSPPPIELGSIAGARVLLGSVSSGLITVAVFGLWMRTVVVGLMAGHFSPRTLLIFLDDRFQRNLLAFMSAGFVAVLVILLRMPTDEQASAPLVSTVLVVLIALVSSIEDDAETDFDAIAQAFNLARTRSPDMDLAFAVSQLVDVGTFAQLAADLSCDVVVMGAG